MPRIIVDTMIALHLVLRWIYGCRKGITPTYAGVGHRQAWCNGYNYGYLATSGGNILRAGDRKTFKKVLIIVTNIPKQLTLKEALHCRFLNYGPLIFAA
jgi:hypothetical protein